MFRMQFGTLYDFLELKMYLFIIALFNKDVAIKTVKIIIIKFLIYCYI